jgi:hypothetical protein
MKQDKTFKKMKGSDQLHPVSEPSKGSGENVLTPVTLSGVVAPWAQSHGGGRTSDYKLISSSGLEYFIVADKQWRRVLSTYCWEEVKVIGLLNVSNMTLIPQKVYPKGPKGENVIDLASWKSQKLVKQWVQKVNELVLIPAAVWAVMAA